MSDRWATFDCYGTLADWVGGIRRALEPVAGADTDALVTAYFAAELEVQAEQPGARYAEVLVESLRRAAARTGVALGPGQDRVLVDAWSSLDIFADVRPALGALRDAGWKLAILSNCDDDLLARTVTEIAVPFDELVTAEQVGSYKPALGHWEAFARRTEGRRGTWIHCANSYVHDVQPSARAGVPCVWIDRDRTGEDDVPVLAHLPGMADLPAVLSAQP